VNLYGDLIELPDMSAKAIFAALMKSEINRF
jgi:hypothetical protein